MRERIEGSSWHPGCPVGLGKLRLLELTYWGFDGDVHHGRLSSTGASTTRSSR